MGRFDPDGQAGIIFQKLQQDTSMLTVSPAKSTVTSISSRIGDQCEEVS